MTDRFTLKRFLPVDSIQFTNNEFESSITGWDQIAGGSDKSFTWNDPSSARAGGGATLANTAAIGQGRPDDSGKNWTPGTYTVAITATNSSTGGSSPFETDLVLYGSDTGSALDDNLSFSGIARWLVGAGEITRTITFTLAQEYKKLFFKFNKSGTTTGYSVDFIIDSIVLTDVQDATDDLEIAEPGAWQGHTINLERHPEFHSLIETLFTNERFIFVGDDNEDGIGGADFVRDVEQDDGFDAVVQFVAETAEDDVNYEEYFTGLLQLEGLEELPENEVEVPVIRDSFWSTFISRFDIPVDVTKNVDLDGNEVDPLEPITVNLTSQKVRMRYEAISENPGIDDFSVSGTTQLINEGDYYPVSFDTEDLTELEEFFTIPQVVNPELPGQWFIPKYSGSYTFTFQAIAYTGFPGFNFSGSEDISDYMSFYLSINGVETAFTPTGGSFDGLNVSGSAVFQLQTTEDLVAGDSVRLYGKGTADLVVGIGSYTGSVRWSGSFNTTRTSVTVTADTVYPDTEVEGYWAHDLASGILARIGLGNNKLYSEWLGSTITKTRQYDADGCGSRFFLTKGVFLRGYTLTDNPDDPAERYSLEEKGFSISFKEWWDGINPILNLGLGYETLNDTPETQVIRIEEKEHFYDDSSTSIDFDFVYDIRRKYDLDKIFKKITIGYKKWESEDISGIDDPQTRHVYATRLARTGKEITIESEFIAASLAIETTRRTKKEKSADYKYDNEVFIIAINIDDASPETSPEIYYPELDENFNSVANLLNSDTRYNLILTPMRMLLRWANYLTGCLQSYLTSSITFQEGEGNYDVETDYDCATGQQCLAVICDSLNESDDIPLGEPSNYHSVFGFLHLPIAYEINIPMTLQEYKTIQGLRKKAIGISQTDSGHVKFLIDDLTYNKSEGTASIIAWPKEFFAINVIETIPEEQEAGPSLDGDYQDFIDYIIDQGFRPPSDEVQQAQSDLIDGLKEIGVWQASDLLYIFATDGDEDVARLNLKNPAVYKAQKVNSPAFISNVGYKGNGTNSYLNTGWEPATDAVEFTLDEGGVFCYINNEIAAGNKAIFGTRDTGVNGQIIHQPKNAFSEYLIALNSNGTPVEEPATSKGFHHIRRVADNDLRLFKNGEQVGSTFTTASNVLSTRDMYILSFNSTGTAGQFTDAEISVFGIGASMAGQEAALNALYNTYKETIVELAPTLAPLTAWENAGIDTRDWTIDATPSTQLNGVSGGAQFSDYIRGAFASKEDLAYEFDWEIEISGGTDRTGQLIFMLLDASNNILDSESVPFDTDNTEVLSGRVNLSPSGKDGVYFAIQVTNETLFNTTIYEIQAVSLVTM